MSSTPPPAPCDAHPARRSIKHPEASVQHLAFTVRATTIQVPAANPATVPVTCGGGSFVIRGGWVVCGVCVVGGGWW